MENAQNHNTSNFCIFVHRHMHMHMSRCVVSGENGSKLLRSIGIVQIVIMHDGDRLGTGLGYILNTILSHIKHSLHGPWYCVVFR